MGVPTDKEPVNLTDNAMPKRMDEVLVSLPAPFVVAASEDARLVVGPSGAFVLLPHANRSIGFDGGAIRLDLLVQATRSALCDHLSWVPFLDALLVTEVDVAGPTPVAVVALDLLQVVLTEGPAVIDDATLRCIRDSVRRQHLDHWRVGSSAGAARIDLCDPAQPTTTH